MAEEESKLAGKIRQLREEKIGATNKRLLLLEGNDDINAFEIFLNKKNLNWNQHWVLAAAGNKKHALVMADLAPDWLVLVDRDEWSVEEVAQRRAECQNLLILPRFCLENYLLNPDEIWSALPPGQQQKLHASGMDQAKFAAQLLVELQAWQRHAALWQVINPLWSGLRARGFQDGLLRTNQFPDDQELQATLLDWHNLIDHDRIWREIQNAMQLMAALDLQTFLHCHLYGKKFFPQVVVPYLNTLLGQKQEAQWRIALLKSMPLPSDLAEVWLKMAL